MFVVGYCPQFDALLDHMTGEEMLYLFAKIRGIAPTMIGPVVDYLIEALDLIAHRHKLTHNYRLAACPLISLTTTTTCISTLFVPKY